MRPRHETPPETEQQVTVERLTFEQAHDRVFQNSLRVLGGSGWGTEFEEFSRHH
jgi:hypothetical protein